VEYLIDSDQVIEHLKGRRAFSELLNALIPSGIAISTMTYAEVYEGIYFGASAETNEAVFISFLAHTQVLDFTPAIARRYARLRGDLRARGMLLPAPDMLIAATAIEHDLTLVTGNLRHFHRVEGLRILTGDRPSEG
jgi:tRNA(fMet)-specific endonuclease VapC